MNITFAISRIYQIIISAARVFVQTAARKPLLFESQSFCRYGIDITRHIKAISILLSVCQLPRRNVRNTYSAHLRSHAHTRNA